jgi:hypothetical protein
MGKRLTKNVKLRTKGQIYFETQQTTCLQTGFEHGGWMMHHNFFLIASEANMRIYNFAT